MNIWKRIWTRWAMRRLTAAQRMAVEWQSEANKVLRRLERNHKRLVCLQRHVETVSATVAENLEDCEQTLRQHAVALEALQNENRINSDVLVPFLTTAGQLMLQRYEAEIAVEVRRQVAAVGRRGEEGE